MPHERRHRPPVKTAGEIKHHPRSANLSRAGGRETLDGTGAAQQSPITQAQVDDIRRRPGVPLSPDDLAANYAARQENRRAAGLSPDPNNDPNTAPRTAHRIRIRDY